MAQRGIVRFTKLFVLELWPWYLGGSLFLAITNVITLEIPQLAKHIVNALQGQISLEEQDLLPKLALAIVALGLTQIFIRSLSRILIFWPGRKLEASSKTYMFARAMQLPQSFFDRFGMGDLISRLSNDLGQLRVFFAFAILQILNLIFIAVFTLYKMFHVHPQLTLAALAPISLMVVSARFVMPRLQRFTKLNQEAIGTLTNRVTESFTHIHVIQSNAAEASFQQRIAEENDKVFDSDMRVLVLRTLFFPLMTSLTGIAQLVVLFFGGRLIMQSELSIGDILAFNFYLAYLAFPLTSIGLVLAIYQRSKTALERLDPFLDEAHEDAALPAPNEFTIPEGCDRVLTIENLNFRYEPQGPWILRNLNIEVKPGEMIGLCGPVGSGKSTLFQLITRLYPKTSGTIRLWGQDIDMLTTQQIRTRIAYALQRVHLFSATIRENLSFGVEPKPSQSELEHAADAAQVLKEILGFPATWETEIGERGLRLSGGQKQRLALARVFLRKADLLLLDDVLSAVDNITEARLIKQLRRRPSAMIVSSHRTSVLEMCDRVILMEAGSIKDQGLFSELLLRHPELSEEIHEEPSPESI